MTSFIIKAQAGRPVPEVWRKDSECAFCQIIHHEARAYRIYEDDHVIAFLGKLPSSFSEAIFLLSYQTDILPLRHGHTLVVPKFHCARVSELPLEYAASVGKAISRISNALTKGTLCEVSAAVSTMLSPAAVDNTALNVVCNQEYAQVVMHVRDPPPSLLHFARSQHLQVHYHIIPAPRSSTFPTDSDPGDRKQKPSPTAKDMHRLEYESRDDLDEDAATVLVERIRAHL